MAWRGFPWGLLATTSVSNDFEDDGKRNLVQEAKKKKTKPLRQAQERRSRKLTAGGDVDAEPVEVKQKQVLHSELEQSPCIFQAELLRVDNCDSSTFRSRLFQMSASVLLSMCSCCMSGYLTSDASDVDIKMDVTNDELSVIWLNGGGSDQTEEDVSTFGNYQFGADSAVQCTNGNTTLDVIVESAEHIIDCREEIMSVDLGGPGGPTAALGGLSLAGYEHIVFSVCSALPTALGTEL